MSRNENARRSSASVKFYLIALFIILQTSQAWSLESYRLSEFLKNHSQAEDSYALGAIWSTPEERQQQKLFHEKVGKDLKELWEIGKLGSNEYDALSSILTNLTLTGRMRIDAFNPKWLEANPRRDPLIEPQDHFLIGNRPDVIRVMKQDGSVCEIRHREGFLAGKYVKACFGERDASS